MAACSKRLHGQSRHQFRFRLIRNEVVCLGQIGKIGRDGWRWINNTANVVL